MARMTTRKLLVFPLLACILCVCIYVYTSTSNTALYWVPNDTYDRLELAAENRTWSPDAIDRHRTASICKIKSNFTSHVVMPTTTNLQNWEFTKHVTCPRFDIRNYTRTRLNVHLDCKSQYPKLNSTRKMYTDDIHTVHFGDQCLADVIDNCCKDSNPVPNVVHYIWYARKPLPYCMFLSFMSVLRFMKPCLILIHGDSLPYGEYWDYFVRISPNVVHVYRTTPTAVYEKKLAFIEHASDVIRIEALQRYGGVYLDYDTILLRPLEPLRKYSYTQGHERTDILGAQFIMAQKEAQFLHKWQLSYKNDYKNEWEWNSQRVPLQIARDNPEMIHIEGYNFTRPNWFHTQLIFEENFDWTINYAMHLYIRVYKKAVDHMIIRTLNTTLGAISRHVLFGNKELCRR